MRWQMALANSLANVHRFSPFQLAPARNPKLPSVFNDKPPVMPSPTRSKILIDSLTALHKAREAYVASESPQKICWALNHNVRTNGDIKYVKGDSIYFKCVNKK